jgi:hypothetical protein
MDPITAGLVAGGIGLIGSSMTNQSNTDIANSANTAAMQRQAEANAFNAQQYSTRYQVTVKDLIEAGLNPMLAYGQGPGTAPTGQAAPVNVPAPRINSLGNASEAARSMSMNAAELLLRKEQTAATNAQTETTRTQGVKNTADALEALTRTEKYGPEIDVLKKTLQVQAAQILNLEAASRASSASAVNTEAITKAGIFSSNPLVQGWSEIKKAAKHAHENRNNIADIPFFGSAKQAFEKRYQQQVRPK